MRFFTFVENFADDAAAMRSNSKKMEAYWYVMYWDGLSWQKFYDPSKSPTPKIGQVSASMERACQKHDIIGLLGVRFNEARPIFEMRTFVLSVNAKTLRDVHAKMGGMSGELVFAGLSSILRQRHWRTWVSLHNDARNGFSFTLPRDVGEFTQAARIIYKQTVNVSPSWDELMDVIAGS
jgi:hypothetical protein